MGVPVLVVKGDPSQESLYGMIDLDPSKEDAMSDYYPVPESSDDRHPARHHHAKTAALVVGGVLAAVFAVELVHIIVGTLLFVFRALLVVLVVVAIVWAVVRVARFFRK